jgi:hypothetical protein
MILKDIFNEPSLLKDLALDFLSAPLRYNDVLAQKAGGNRVPATLEQAGLSLLIGMTALFPGLLISGKGALTSTPHFVAYMLAGMYVLTPLAMKAEYGLNKLSVAFEGACDRLDGWLDGKQPSPPTVRSAMTALEAFPRFAAARKTSSPPSTPKP